MVCGKYTVSALCTLHIIACCPLQSFSQDCDLDCPAVNIQSSMMESSA